MESIKKPLTHFKKNKMFYNLYNNHEQQKTMYANSCSLGCIIRSTQNVSA